MERFTKKIIIFVIIISQSIISLSQDMRFLDSLFSLSHKGDNYGCYMVINVNYGDTVAKTVVTTGAMQSILYKIGKKNVDEIDAFLSYLIVDTIPFNIYLYDNIENLYTENTFQRVNTNYVDSLQKHMNIESIIKKYFTPNMQYKYKTFNNSEEFFAIIFILFNNNIITYVPRKTCKLTYCKI